MDIAIYNKKLDLRILEIPLVLIVSIIAFQFKYIWEAMSPTYLEDVALSLAPRPYVYRALLPLLARTLSFLLGLDPGSSLLLLFVLASIGLYYSIKYLYTGFYPDGPRASLVSFGACLGILLLLFVAPHPYDLPTAAFFALALGLLGRGDLKRYYLLFPIATLNRETTFLLLVFFAVSFLGRLKWRDYVVGLLLQVWMYMIVRGLSMNYFAGRPGTSFDWNLDRNIRSLIGSPLLSLILLGLLVIILFFVLRNWKEKPGFLRSAFLIIFPLQVLLYILLGGILELRVFAEIAPVALLLIASR